MLCPETKKPMFAKVDPTMEFERELFSHSSNIPLCKRFKNFEKYSKFETSTPKNSFLECVPEPKSFPPKSPIKEPILKLEPKLPTPKLPDAIKSFENTVLSLSSKVESTKISTEVPKVFEKEPVLDNLERNDLRYVLLSKRKSFGAADTAVERKKPKADEIKPRTPKKKVTFNLEDETDAEAIDDNSFIPLTPNLSWSTIESPKSPFKLKDKIPPSFVKETYETPPLNVKDLTPNYQQIPTKQLPTFQLNAMKQISTSQQNATNHAPTFQPISAKKLPTFQLNATKQTSTCLQNATNQGPTIQSTSTNHLPTFQFGQKQLSTSQQNATNQGPTSTNQLPTFQFAQKQLPTSQQNATNQGSTFQPTATNQSTTFKNTTWYVVADTDVLLLDYEFIEKLVLSDQKCRLVIPHMVVSDIEALCLGDCRGQQRVINARQLTRKLATPPPYCIVEPRTSNGDLFVTTDCILHCCMKALNRNYYVVLITNDPHLLIRATTLNIHAYKLNEIQYGVDISPKSALEQKNTQKTNTVNNTPTNTEKLLNQKGSLFSNFNEKSEEKIIKMSAEINKNIRSPIKPLCLSSDSETVTSDDILINITKPKSIENIENDTNSIDSDCTSDIFISNIQLNDKKVLKPQNVAKNPFHLQNGFVNFEKRILNPNAVFKTNNLEIKIPNENSIKNVNNSFENDYLDYNFENKDEFYSVPITNIADSVSENSSSNKCLKLRQSTLGIMQETIKNPSQIRIEKIMNAINIDSVQKNQLDGHNTNAKETTAVFKIPKLLPIKSKTKNKSVLGEMSNANVKIGTNTSIDNVDQSLKKFRINNRFMRAKLNARSEEWICTYMQILEDVLVNLLQKNKMCMENTVAPLTIKDTLNCIKMLYDAHTKVRDVINKLSELLDKYMIGVQGQFKMPVGPEDFMKIFGCGVLLVHALEDILPLNEDLAEAKSRLKALHNNLQSYAKESDPELVKSPYSSRTDKNDEEIRPPFFKNPSYVLNYLKKHFKEWETYKDHSEEQNHKIENHTDFTVVRTLGKNLNLLKFDKLKNMSLTNITEEKDLLNKQEYKIMRQLDNNLIEANNETVETKTNIETKLIRLNDKEKNPIIFEENLTKNQEISPVNKTTEQKLNLESKDDDFNYSSHENTFLEENMEKDDTKVIRNAKVIEEFENKVVTREPLDLDLLDYSEIYEPSIDKNVDFDVLSENNEKTVKDNNFDVNNTINCDIETPVFTLEDFYITPSLSPESDKNNKIDDSKITEINESTENINSVHNVTSSYFNIETENNNVTSTNKEENIEKNNSEIESETFTEKQNSNNDSCIENDNSEKLIDSSGTRNYDSGTHNYDIGNSGKIVQDDSINDSGFENDSTYAHTLLKVFLKELCSTFTVIHTFINKFIDEISETELSAKQMNVYHNQASKALEDMVAIINHLKAIIKRESPEDTVLKMLLRNAGVEAAADKRMMRYRAIVIKCLEQAKILESALKIIVSTTIGDFDALSTNTENLHPDFRYFNIFEPNHQPFVGNT